ncbi:MAG: hypothetical protein V4594_05135 [Bacteroidota bacterium]
MQPVSKLKTIQTIHLAFCSAILAFAAVATLTVKDKIYFEASFSQDNPFYPLFPILGIIAVVAGVFLFNKNASAIAEMETLDKKLTKYQEAFLIRTALLEGAALMNTVAFLISANLVFLLVVAIPFLTLVRFRPTKDSIIETLNLQYPESEQLN